MDPNEKMLIAAAAGILVGWIIWGRKPPCSCPPPPPAQGVGGMVAAGEACKRC
jgi:hypothetical protein